jgi:hypothetical protein
MAIEKSTSQFGIEFPTAYNKAVWINLNGNGGEFTTEVTVKTWKDAAARQANAEPIKTENIVLAPDKETTDQIRAIVYRMMAKDGRFVGGTAV